MISEYFIPPFIHTRPHTIYAVSLHPFVILANVVPHPLWLPPTIE